MSLWLDVQYKNRPLSSAEIWNVHAFAVSARVVRSIQRTLPTQKNPFWASAGERENRLLPCQPSYKEYVNTQWVIGRRASLCY